MDAVAAHQDRGGGLDVQARQEHHEDPGDVVEALVIRRQHVGGILDLQTVDVAARDIVGHDDVIRLPDVDPRIAVAARGAMPDHAMR